MLISLLTLIALAITWVLLLWFALPIDFSTRSTGALIVAHCVPPLLLWAGWMAIRIWRRRHEARKLAEVDAAAEAERLTAEITIRQQQAVDLAKLQFGCDCRHAVISGLVESGASLPAALQVSESAPVEQMADDEHDDDGDEQHRAESPSFVEDLLAFAVPLRQALESIYSSAPAALALPLYVLPPSHVATEEAKGLIHQLVHEIGDGLALANGVSGEDVEVHLIPEGEGASDRVNMIFDRHPELPGAVVIAFDAPSQRELAAYKRLCSSDERAAMDAEIDERERWFGKPVAAVVALLITHPNIDEMLAQIRDFDPVEDSQNDAMTPYWAKGNKPVGPLADLARVAADERNAIGQLPQLARIHRGAFGPANLQARPAETLSSYKALVQRALMISSMLPTPVTSNEETSEPDSSGGEQFRSPPPLGWLTHNAGTVDRYGPRFGALATAVRSAGFDLHPLDEATNFAQVVGNLGAATAWAMLADTVTRVYQNNAPALICDFQQDDGLAMSIAMPLGSAKV